MDLVKLTETEKTIVKNRLKGLPFCDLAGNDRQYFLDQIIARIAAATGCDLPQTDFFGGILSEELAGIIVDFSYDSMTLAEMVFSIRLNSNPSAMKMPSGVELEPIVFSGRMANSYFLSRLLHNYMILRNLLDRKLQNFIDGHE